jgi:hypothetical protein
MPDLEEFFFSLPRVHRDLLEYLCVVFAKLDLMARKSCAPAPVPLPPPPFEVFWVV